MRYILLAILLLCLADIARAQQFSFHHYDTKDGLAGSVAHSISQDRDGFLWFCTETGLSRFDGKTFRNYTRSDGLPSNEVFYTYADSRNRLWIASFKNAICYYYKGRIYNQQNDPQLGRLKLPCQVTRVYENTRREIILHMADNSFYLLPPHSDSAITYLPPGTRYSPERAARMHLYRERVAFPAFSSDSFVRRLVSDSVRFEAFRQSTAYTPACYLLKKEHRIYLLYPAAKRMGTIGDGQVMFAKLLDNSQVALLSRHSGVQLYDLDRRRIVASYLAGQRVHDVFRDREGNIWFTTNGSGVYRLSNPGIREYTFGSARQPSAVHDIFRYKGTLQVMIDYGGCRELRQERATQGDSLYRVVYSRFDMEKAKSVAGRTITLANSDFDSLFRGWPIPQVTVKTIYYANDTLYIAGGSRAFNLKVSACRVLDTPLLMRSTCTMPWQGYQYIGTLDGLYRYRQGKREYAGADPLLRNRISALAAGSDSLLWVGTYEEGVAGYRNGRIVARIRSQQGLAGNICRCLFVQGRFLWIGTEKGIYKVDLYSGTYPVVARYGRGDGLGSDIINAIYVEGNTVYAGTQTGLTVFDERKIAQQGPCNVVMTGISISGREQPPDSQLVLDHRDNNIRFDFSGISFLSAGNIAYQYRLLGLDTQWRRTGESFVSYPALPKGTYIFQVKAVNKFGTESTLKQQSFRILPSFWERSWVRIAAALLCLLLALYLFQWRIKQIRRKYREQQELRKKVMDLEQMALRAQMNPHFIFNCLNSIQHFVLDSDPRSANFYISRFARLVRSTLENASRMYLSLQEEVAYLKSYIELERMQLMPPFQYRIDIAGTADPARVQVPNMLIQPLLENAVKHGVARLGDTGLITLRFNYDPLLRGTLCVLTDNGPGWQQTSQTDHQPKGMSITGERIRILNELSENGRKITLRHGWAYPHPETPYGTRIELFFPDKS